MPAVKRAHYSKTSPSSLSPSPRATHPGRRIWYNWGPRYGYNPLPWYETNEFKLQAAQGQGVPEVRGHQLNVTLVPYQATMVNMPPGVAPGGIFSFAHPGSTQNYLVAGPANSAPGLQVGVDHY